ncbi:endonuclease III [Pseudoleptotrichia goodfellowii]|uniref:Endonuclease III n=1 Tax=Pseudoleptotrichia goodfellowii F0264 TaxID=596323 RepID=D0GN04_9FUSO|nr:endonuclease III [Pseudoleptotrichia goodfellowii]EEY34526.1 endonuclease III [Pseudoleptotrichia goodfellowii F0264]MBF4805633.1 endonuclease III [Pseudoleptotrichia goodfellowii]
MTKKERFNLIFPYLQERYGKPKCALDFETSYQLMIAVILSAQCTDARVNIVTKELFKVVKTPEDIHNMDLETLEKYIKSTGFYRNKAKNIKLNAEQVLNEYNGKIPKKMDELVKLAGVGRKTANVVLGEVWGISEGIVVDTHVKRLSKRMGLTKSDNPEIIERELMKIVPKKYWFVFSHYLILYGREVSTAINPKCDICIINKYFNYCEKEKAEKQRKKVAKKK